MKKLYFVRHGESELNVSGHFAGHTETPLTKKGIAQAKVAGKIAKDLDIDLIVSSPLERALDTAELIARGIGYPPKKIMLNDLLVERFYGTAEKTPYSTHDKHLDNFEHFETEKELRARAKKLIDWLNDLDAENVLIVSHGGIGRRVRAVLKPKHDFLDRIPNARIERWL